jgi:CRP-like cAMP-binding protein
MSNLQKVPDDANIMYNQFKQQVAKIITLTEAEYAHFLASAHVKEFKRKEMILTEGEICKYSYFVNKGCMRYFHVVDGEQHTGQFFLENTWYTDFESFLTVLPSRQNIEALEKTELIMFSKMALEKLYKEIPKFERFGRLMAERAFIGLRTKTEMLALHSPEERYLNLIKQRPKLIQRVSQHYIASYLGIKPQSLSRIRKRILAHG